MGFYDREYYRGSRGRFIDNFSTSGQVCKWLIIINVIVFLLQIITKSGGPGGGGLITDLMLLDTAKVYSGQVWRLLTYAFLHAPGDIWHILFNMLFLFWFGRELEEMYGSREFLSFYLVAALLGGIGFAAIAGLNSLQAGGSVTAVTMRCLGASGAVTAVLLVYACHFPFRTILLFFILPIPIWFFVGFMVISDLFIFTSGTETTTAVTVHLSGALFGFLYYKFGWRVSNLWSNIKVSSGRRSRPKLRVYHGEEAMHEEALVSPPKKPVDEQLEAKLDAVLEKIKTSGQESLTESERKLLLQASEIYKKRREEV